MKQILKLLVLLFVVASQSTAQQLTHVIGQPIGFASLNGGVTGGEGGTVVTVTNEAELKAAVDGTNNPMIVLVKGTIRVSGEMSARGNKTIVGLGTDARIAGGGFGWNTKSNVIVQNITFEDASDDLLKINNKSTNFWIDHCTFSDGESTHKGSHDGMLDITRGSKFITVSNCKFFNHDKNVLIGHSDSETGDVDIKVTMHHNWFDGTVQRNPRVRYATVHLFNNYHVNNRIYGVASACNANVLVENSYFKDTQIPLQVGVPGFSPAGFLVQNGCYFENCGTPQLKTKDMAGLFPYNYSLDDVMLVPCIAETYAGAGKERRSIENFNCAPRNPNNGGGTGGNNGGGTGGGTPDDNGCVWLRTPYFTNDADENNWFWFNNETSANKYMPSPISLLPSVSSSGVSSSLQTTKVGAGTDGTSASTGAITGCIDLGKSATKGSFTGGSIIFDLESCGELKIISSRTGDNTFNVSVMNSNDSEFTQKYVYTGANGISVVNLSEYVQSELPLKIKITNGATGSLNIHAVGIKTYIKDCTNRLAEKRVAISHFEYMNNRLSFSSHITGPAEVKLMTIDGRVIQSVFRGWVEAGIDNYLPFYPETLKNGVYLLVLKTDKDFKTIKLSL